MGPASIRIWMLVVLGSTVLRSLGRREDDCRKSVFVVRCAWVAIRSWRRHGAGFRCLLDWRVSAFALEPGNARVHPFSMRSCMSRVGGPRHPGVQDLFVSFAPLEDTSVRVG